MKKRKSEVWKVEAWNSAHPIGTPVKLRTDSRGVVDTKTRSAAMVSASGYAIIFLDGIRGYYLLERVKA